MTGEVPERDPAIREILAGPGTITAISGLAFAISDELGDIHDPAHGLMVLDTRHLSRFVARFDGAPMHGLAAGVLAPEKVTFRGYLWPASLGALDPPVEVERTRRVRRDGLTEVIRLRSWVPQPISVRIGVEVDADFADIFEVRQHAPPATRDVERSTDGGELRLSHGAHVTRVTACPEGPLEWTVPVARGQPFTLEIRVRAHSDATEAATPELARPHAARHPAIVTDPDDLQRACAQSLVDLGALSMPDPLDRRRRIIAAGIPWFVALFGRDSLLAAHLARATDDSLLIETLAALAARQGRIVDPGNEEAPGKILHEVRLTTRPWLGTGTSGGARPYYGSVDATPLWLIMLGEAWRWGAPRRAVEELLPAARAALAWLRSPAADPDGDGFIEYRASGPRSLANQSWKDSANAVQYRDGTIADAPIAMVEVQGYAVRARRELAAVLEGLGHPGEAEEMRAEADALRRCVRERFWIPGRDGQPGYFAMALDGDKRPVDAVASNMAHLLWSGVPSNDEAAQVAAHLMSPQMSSGWGLRTLSAAMGGYNPISYHGGSVWPHDTTIAIEGLRRYGHDHDAARLAGQILDACAPFDDRLPELFGGHPRTEVHFPVPYPMACRPQAWAAGVPVALVPVLLGLEPDIPAGRISLAPALPTGMSRLEVRGVRFPGGVLSVAVTPEGAQLLASPADVGVEFRAHAGAATRSA